MTEDSELSVSELIIAFVRDARPLWDMHDKKYHDNNLTNNLWTDISRQINIDVIADPKKKWKNLRDRYVKCLKERKGKSGQAATKQKEWALVEHLNFLKDILSPRSTTESYFQPSQPPTNQPPSKDLPGCQEISIIQVQEFLESDNSLSTPASSVAIQELPDFPAGCRTGIPSGLEGGSSDCNIQPLLFKRPILSPSNSRANSPLIVHPPSPSPPLTVTLPSLSPSSTSEASTSSSGEPQVKRFKKTDKVIPLTWPFCNL